MTEVHFINVGYGDASLILREEPGGSRFAMLIDCGGETVGEDPTGSRIPAWEYIKKLGIEKIDIVLLTHLHLDHAGGILEIARNFAVGELWTNYVPAIPFLENKLYTNETLDAGPRNLLASLRLYIESIKILVKKGTLVRGIHEGFSMQSPFGEIRILAGNPAFYMRQSEILNRVFAGGASNAPLLELDGFINNTSLRVQAQLGGSVFLFAGDIYAPEWEKERIEAADVVKIPHHGHADSLSEFIAERLCARYAVISVSNTREDCPDTYVLCILKRAGARILFTDAVKTNGPVDQKHSAIIFRPEGGLRPEFSI